jgi:hypothetical protein
MSRNRLARNFRYYQRREDSIELNTEYIEIHSPLKIEKKYAIKYAQIIARKRTNNTINKTKKKDKKISKR